MSTGFEQIQKPLIFLSRPISSAVLHCHEQNSHFFAFSPISTRRRMGPACAGESIRGCGNERGWMDSGEAIRAGEQIQPTARAGSIAAFAGYCRPDGIPGHTTQHE
jgi:hypothetical protein